MLEAFESYKSNDFINNKFQDEDDKLIEKKELIKVHSFKI